LQSKDEAGSVFQTRPKPNRNESDGEHRWRLIFVADGLNWWRKHHHQKDRGEVEPINSLTALPLVAHICASLKIELRNRLITFPIFVCSQRLITRNDRELFSSNLVVKHFLRSLPH
jgi:hypothetical protein